MFGLQSSQLRRRWTCLRGYFRTCHGGVRPRDTVLVLLCLLRVLAVACWPARLSRLRCLRQLSTSRSSLSTCRHSLQNNRTSRAARFYPQNYSNPLAAVHCPSLGDFTLDPPHRLGTRNSSAGTLNATKFSHNFPAARAIHLAHALSTLCTFPRDYFGTHNTNHSSPVYPLRLF